MIAEKRLRLTKKCLAPSISPLFKQDLGSELFPADPLRAAWFDDQYIDGPSHGFDAHLKPHRVDGRPYGKHGKVNAVLQGH
jgi:hypothetical protein